MSTRRAREWTLFAHEPLQPVPFPRFDDLDGRPRYRLDLPGLDRLRDTWQTLTTADGHIVQVRRADCGLACRCAGEFRITS